MTDAPPPLILASGSPRRADVLRQLGLTFEVRPTDVDETPRAGEPPGALAERLARAKASERAVPGALSFGFDTVVWHEGSILGKPRSVDEATRMVERLAGDTHVVFTGIAAATPERVLGTVEQTRVRFRRLRKGEPEAYVQTGEPLDKAGAYGIQGAGAALVAGIEGDFFNVMGFPVQRFQELLEAFGWRYHFGTLVPGHGVAHAGDDADTGGAAE